MLVLDTSAAIDALAGTSPASGLIERLGDDGDLHAPHLIDVEFIQALRRLEAAGHLGADRARDLLDDFLDLPVVRYPQHHLAERIWDLRHNLTAYDAAYVALAESLDVPLVTCDARLASAPGHRARVEVFD